MSLVRVAVWSLLVAVVGLCWRNARSVAAGPPTSPTASPTYAAVADWVYCPKTNWAHMVDPDSGGVARCMYDGHHVPLYTAAGSTLDGWPAAMFN